MRLRGFFFLLLVLISGGGCTTAYHGVLKSYAYWQAIYPGNLPGHLPGMSKTNSIDTSLMVYIETTREATPVWDTARRNGAAYLVSTELVPGDSVSVGAAKATAQPVFIKTKMGNRLWLVKLKDKISGNTPLGGQKNTEIILAGTYHQKRITATITYAIELQPQRRP